LLLFFWWEVVGILRGKAACCQLLLSSVFYFLTKKLMFVFNILWKSMFDMRYSTYIFFLKGNNSQKLFWQLKFNWLQKNENHVQVLKEYFYWLRLWSVVVFLHRWAPEFNIPMTIKIFHMRISRSSNRLDMVIIGYFHVGYYLFSCEKN